MREAIKHDYEHRMTVQARQIRDDEAEHIQQLKETYESKIEDQLGLKLEYENKMGKLVDQYRLDEKERLNKFREEYEAKIQQMQKSKEEDDLKLDIMKSGYEEKLEKSEQKYKSLSKTFQALKNHELNLQNKASAKQDKIEMQKLHTLVSLMWNMLSTVDSEIAHFESLDLPGFDWDKHANIIQNQEKVYDLPALAYNSSAVSNPPPLSNSKLT